MATTYKSNPKSIQVSKTLCFKMINQNIEINANPTEKELMDYDNSDGYPIAFRYFGRMISYYVFGIKFFSRIVINPPPVNRTTMKLHSNIT